MADIRSQPEEDSGTDRTLKTILLGDFDKNPTFSGLAVRATISVVPGLDQLADVQDTAAWVLLCRDEGLENSEVRLNGLLLGIGWIPVIGSVGKGVLKVLSSSAAGKSVAKLVEHLNFLGKGNGVKWLKEFSGDLPALAKQAASKMKAILYELHDMLSKLKELVPQKLTQKLDEWRSAVMRVRNQIDEMFAKAADDLKAQLDDALADFSKGDLDLPSGTKTSVVRTQKSTPPPSAPGLINQQRRDFELVSPLDPRAREAAVALDPSRKALLDTAAEISAKHPEMRPMIEETLARAGPQQMKFLQETIEHSKRMDLISEARGMDLDKYHDLVGKNCKLDPNIVERLSQPTMSRYVRDGIEQHSSAQSHHSWANPLETADDIIDALRQQRCYKPSMTYEKIEEVISSFKDPMQADALRSALDYRQNLEKAGIIGH